jgi:hypothetical protein
LLFGCSVASAAWREGALWPRTDKSKGADANEACPRTRRERHAPEQRFHQSQDGHRAAADRGADGANQRPSPRGEELLPLRITPDGQRVRYTAMPITGGTTLYFWARVCAYAGAGAEAKAHRCQLRISSADVPPAASRRAESSDAHDALRPRGTAAERGRSGAAAHAEAMRW